MLCNSLCFLINKFGKVDIRTLKSSILDFYEVDELCGAKRQLLSDVNSMNLDIDAPHVPDRRDGENKAARTVDDIFRLITFLDENMKLSSLPRYVASGPDSMPSVRLYEGDLSILMKVIERMENQIKELNLAVTNIANGAAVLNCATNNLHLGDGIGIHMQPGVSVHAANDGVERSAMISQQQPGDPLAAGTECVVRDWAAAAATTAAASTPVNVHNRFSVLSPMDDDENRNELPFIESRVRRLAKRRRNNSQQPQQQPQQQRQPQMQTQINQRQSIGTQRRGGVVMTGKSVSTGQRFNAAKHIIKKAIYCVDNVDPSLAVTDLCQFVNSLGVKVLSCFSVKPRRRRNEVKPIVDRKAFRLSIDAADQEKLLDETRWPDSVVISKWYYLDPSKRSQSQSQSQASDRRDDVVTVSDAEQTVSNDVDGSHDNPDDTVIYQGGNATENLGHSSSNDHGD